MECVFCRVAQGTKPEAVLFRDDDVVAFNDIHPKAPVHILVIPKLHIPSIAHLEEDHSGVIAKLIYTAKRIAAARGLKGYKLAFNVGREGGQVIDHLHLHLVGGWQHAEDWKKGLVGL